MWTGVNENHHTISFYSIHSTVYNEGPISDFLYSCHSDISRNCVSTKGRLYIDVCLALFRLLQTHTAVTHSEVIWLKVEAISLHRESASMTHLHFECRIRSGNCSCTRRHPCRSGASSWREDDVRYTAFAPLPKFEARCATPERELLLVGASKRPLLARSDGGQGKYCIQTIARAKR